MGVMQQQMMGQRPPMPNNMMPAMPQQPMMRPQAPMQAPSGPMPGMPGMPQMNQQNMQQNMTPEQKYMMTTQKFIPAVNEKNPHMKDQVGQCIYDFVVMMVGLEKAPKITGMLLELPIQQIKNYMSSFQALQMKVMEANEHLMKAMGQESTPH